MTDIVAKPIEKTEQEPQAPLLKTGSEEPAIVKNDDDIPVSLYQDRFHKPYVAEFLGLNDNLLVKLDQGLTDQMQAIDKFIIDQINKAELNDDKKSYNKIVNNLLDMLGIDKLEKPRVIIGKLNSLLHVRNLFK